MRRLFPDRLGPQLALLAVGLLVAVQLVSFAAFALLRPGPFALFEPEWLAERLAALADEGFAQPAEARAAWFAARPETRWFTFEFEDKAPALHAREEMPGTAWMRDRLAAESKRAWHIVDISVAAPPRRGPGSVERVPARDESTRPVMPVGYFEAVFGPAAGEPVLVVRPPPPDIAFRALTMIGLWLAIFAAVASLVAWWAFARIAAPLDMLARAAERFGRGIADDALPRRGAREIRTIADSFAEMRRRVARFVSDRTTMLAAVSHDLRTPLTRMRLRLERMPHGELRAALERDIDALEAIARETLEFARLDETAAAPDRIDLASLLSTLADERADMGQDVCYSGPPHLAVRARADGLSRAIGNLVDNAVAYGVRARLSLSEDAACVRVDIDDDGPGIPEARLDDVFRPFVRLEDSRNRATGGTGLGLAIARNLVRAQGGEVTLVNRPGGGLRAGVTLPKGN